MQTTEEAIRARIQDAYPYAASRPANTAPRPEDVEKAIGPLGSYVAGGRRYFCFTTAKERNTFATNYDAMREPR